MDSSVMTVQSPEFYFRLGVILCAIVFFIEATGNPLDRSIVVLAASGAMALLVTLTLAFQWRVLGDWRRLATQFILGGLFLTLAIPLTAIMTPSLSQLALPGAVEPFIDAMTSEVSRIPGVSGLFAFIQGLIVFLLYVVAMIILILQADSVRRSGIIFLGFLFLAALLAFYPSVETIVGIIFMGLAFGLQWETPLLISPRLRPHLNQVQLDYLRELIREGSLSTGETKIYLEQKPEYFAELLDFQLVEIDSIARDILPGKRLLHDPACETMERVVQGIRRGFWIVVGLLYFLLPDLIPFYIDDAIVMLIASGAGLNWIRVLLGQQRNGGRKLRRR